MTIGKLKKIDKQLNARSEQADFVTSTFDTENETPKHWRLTRKKLTCIVQTGISSVVP
ncbi:MAG: hypothetical protein ACYDC8_12795 [Gammaproteobacteria bacterium]